MWTKCRPRRRLCETESCSYLIAIVSPSALCDIFGRRVYERYQCDDLSIGEWLSYLFVKKHLHSPCQSVNSMSKIHTIEVAPHEFFSGVSYRKYDSQEAFSDFLLIGPRSCREISIFDPLFDDGTSSAHRETAEIVPKCSHLCTDIDTMVCEKSLVFYGNNRLSKSCT